MERKATVLDGTREREESEWESKGAWQGGLKPKRWNLRKMTVLHFKSQRNGNIWGA